MRCAAVLSWYMRGSSGPYWPHPFPLHAGADWNTHTGWSQPHKRLWGNISSLQVFVISPFYQLLACICYQLLLSAPFKCLLSPSALRLSHSVQFAEAGQVGRASTVTGGQIQRNPKKIKKKSKKIKESHLWNFKVFRKASEVEVLRDCGAMNAKLNQNMCFFLLTQSAMICNNPN